MITEVTMPSMGADMTEGTIVKWLKKEGDEVKRGDKLAEIETDKTVVEMESYGEGILKKIVIGEGQVVPVGDLIAYVGEEGDEIPSSSSSSEETPSATIDTSNESTPPSIPQNQTSGARVKASPIAKKLANELGVDISTISGTGPGGRITREDVEAASGGDQSAQPSQSSGDTKTIPLTSMRKAIAGVVSKSKSEIPHFYISNTADMSDVIKSRSEFNESKGLKVSVNDIVLYAVTQSLKKFPKFNSSFRDGSLIENQSINIGMAIDLSNSAKDLAVRAKGEGAPLTQEENSGGTFSVSNLGMFDIDQFTAIIVPPQSAILSVGKAREEAVVENGEIKTAQLMKMTLSVDHRVNDGAEAAMFLAELKSILESPTKIFG